MELLGQEKKEKQGINKNFLVAFLIAAVLIAVGIGLLSLQPSFEEQKAQKLEGAFLEGTPQFAEITKDLIIETDFDKTVQSPTAFGTVMMAINGTIRNKGNKTIDGLEINVSVVTQKNEVLKEKRILVVPVQHSVLTPGQLIPVALTLDGFDKKDDRANIRWKVTAIRTAN